MDESTGFERAQAQRGHVELAMHLGIGREGHLEPPIEKESVVDIGPDPTTGGVGRVEDDRVDATRLEFERTHQPGESRSDDDRGTGVRDLELGEQHDAAGQT